MNNTRQPRPRQAPPLLDVALEYAERGWSLIPIKPGTKTPACRSWKPFQEKPPDRKTLRRWFGKGTNGVAVVLGPVSGGLVARDFDDMAAYNRWAKDHADLARTLPTVATARGRHVYFRADLDTIKHCEDGELRGGGYCLLPPSRHPAGSDYEWIVSLPDGEVPFIADVVAAGFIPGEDVTQKAQETSRNSQRKSQVIEGVGMLARENNFSLSSSQKDFIEEVMARSLPTKPGERRKKLFDIVRQIKFAAEFAGIPATEIKFLHPYLKRWWSVAKPKTSGNHPFFSTTWQDFVFAWEEARISYGETMNSIYEKARSTPPPKLAAKTYGQGSARALLASFCRELQHFGGGNSFYLSGRVAEPYFSVSAMQIWRWLQQLSQDRIIQVVKKYPRETRLATEYQYLLDD